jgi:hypothetical protein
MKRKSNENTPCSVTRFRTLAACVRKTVTIFVHDRLARIACPAQSRLFFRDAGQAILANRSASLCARRNYTGLCESVSS